MKTADAARVFAFFISAIALAGIALNLAMLSDTLGDPLRSLWILLGYFTILTNLIVGIVFGVVALRGPGAVDTRILGGTTLSIMLVGVIYALLLSGVPHLAGVTVITNILHHQLTPVLVPLFWLLFTQKGTLNWRDPVIWAAYPLAYAGYALLRGTVEGHFAYGFIDYVTNGVLKVAMTILIIALAFLITGWLIVLLDRVLAQQRGKSETIRK